MNIKKYLKPPPRWSLAKPSIPSTIPPIIIEVENSPLETKVILQAPIFSLPENIYANRSIKKSCPPNFWVKVSKKNRSTTTLSWFPNGFIGIYSWIFQTIDSQDTMGLNPRFFSQKTQIYIKSLRTLHPHRVWLMVKQFRPHVIGTDPGNAFLGTTYKRILSCWWKNLFRKISFLFHWSDMLGTRRVVHNHPMYMSLTHPRWIARFLP